MSREVIVNTIPLLGERSGVGKYTFEVVSRLALIEQDVTWKYYYGYYSDMLPLDAQGGEQSVGSLNTGQLAGYMKRILSKNSFTKRIAKKLLTLTTCLHAKEYDLYFEPNHVFHPGLRARHSAITVHDFSCIRFPDWHPLERVHYFEKYFLPSLERAERIITVSEAIRQEAITLFGFAEKKVVTIHNGINTSHYFPPTEQDAARIRKSFGLEGNFILFVGAMEPRKNLSALLRAYEALPQSVKTSTPLVIAGAQGWNNTDIRTAINRIGKHVRVLGFVSEQDLPALYGVASVFVYPSWYEGFGMPLLEAMACGCPVVTSRDPALMEVSGDAAIHVASDNIEALRDALCAVLEDEALRSSLVHKGFERYSRFSWDDSARNHAALFSILCGN